MSERRERCYVCGDRVPEPGDDHCAKCIAKMLLGKPTRPDKT